MSSKARGLADLGNAFDDGALSNRNLIINGAMQVAQRGTSVTGITSTGYYTSDRWRLESSTDATFTVENVSDSPDGFSNSTKVTVTTADTSIGATQYGVIAQRIEAQNLQQLKYGTSSAQEVTVSFWVKSSTTDGFSLTLEHGDTALYISKPLAINSSNTWEYKTFTFVGDTSTVINNDNGTGLHFYLLFAAGSTYNTGASSTWTSVGALGGGINNNWIGTTNATVQITGVQLEVGDTATPFEHRSYGDELQRCQRYCCKHEATNDYDFMFLGYVENGSAFRAIVNYPVEMRADPSLSASGSWRLALGSQADQDVTFSTASSNTTRLTCYVRYVGLSLTLGHAGIALGYAGAKVIFDAEL
jgi:hypothetical protein